MRLPIQSMKLIQPTFRAIQYTLKSITMSHIIAMAIIAEVTTIIDVTQDAHVDNPTRCKHARLYAHYTRIGAFRC